MANQTATDEHATRTTKPKSANRLGTEIGKKIRSSPNRSPPAQTPRKRDTNPALNQLLRWPQGGPRSPPTPDQPPPPDEARPQRGFGTFQKVLEWGREGGRGGGLRLLGATLAARGPLRWPLRQSLLHGRSLCPVPTASFVRPRPEGLKGEEGSASGSTCGWVAPGSHGLRSEVIHAVCAPRREHFWLGDGVGGVVVYEPGLRAAPTGGTLSRRCFSQKWCGYSVWHCWWTARESWPSRDSWLSQPQFAAARTVLVDVILCWVHCTFFIWFIVSIKKLNEIFFMNLDVNFGFEPSFFTLSVIVRPIFYWALEYL
jgi:hypothetical protein